MSCRKSPAEGNNGTRVVVCILIRTAMHQTLLEMFEQSKGDGGNAQTFEGFLCEHLENIAADFRSRQWRSQHEAAKPERKADRPGAAYANAASDLREQEEV
jgi:hypothetical protein